MKRASSQASVASSKIRVKEYGEKGTVKKVKANFFKIEKHPDINLFQYRVDFVPEIDNTITKRKIVAKNKVRLGLPDAMTFDGSSLYMNKDIEESTFEISDEQFDKNIKITLRQTRKIKNSDREAEQVVNLIMRDTLAALKLQRVKRNYYDPKASIDVPVAQLQLWPGYLTSIRFHENAHLLNCEIVHKFMRNETILQIVNQIMAQNPNTWRDKMLKAVIGTTVLADYSNKTYLIDDIDYGMTPNSSFTTMRGKETKYAQYYKDRYSIEIKDMRQFMLVSRARERDIRAGNPELIYLVPELCRATGLTEDMRNDFRLMQNISNFTRLNPEKRVLSLLKFNERIRETPDAHNCISKWGMELSSDLIDVEARELPLEDICFGKDRMESPNHKAEWNIKATTSMFKSVSCTRWVFIYPNSIEKEAGNFLNALLEAGSSMAYDIKAPMMCGIVDDRQDNYIRKIQEISEKKPNFFLIALPTNRADRYSSIKKILMIDHGIPCQIVVKNKTMNNRNLHSIATKVAIQINTKLGGIPWMVKIPVSGLMFVGFDVSHHPRDKSKSIGALVCTMDLKKIDNTDAKTSSFYSTTMEYKDGNEMVEKIDAYLKEAIQEYKNNTGSIPEKIIFYRDGIGEGQVDTVMVNEVRKIVDTLQPIYGSGKVKLAYILVNKRINTRFFEKNNRAKGFQNPPPGTVVDREVTMCNRHDFYLISQHVGQGTVAPTYYNVIYNETDLNMDRLQILTYKLSYLYFNWSGTVRIPAVSQYAKKLAFMTCQFLNGKSVHEKLKNSLYFV